MPTDDMSTDDMPLDDMPTDDMLIGQLSRACWVEWEFRNQVGIEYLWDGIPDADDGHSTSRIGLRSVRNRITSSAQYAVHFYNYITLARVTTMVSDVIL
nr:hypothetical protein BaRGS_016691 [Batillaria attramentaria]